MDFDQIKEIAVYGGKDLDDCPFKAFEDLSCTASLSFLSCDSKRREMYCATEDYTNCPLFISRLLIKE